MSPHRSLLVKHACIMTGDGAVVPDGYLLVHDGTIAKIGRKAPPRTRAAHVIDAGGRYLVPGFINPHMHCYGALARGMPLSRMRHFGEVLKNLWWRLDQALSLEDVYVSALLSGIECIKSGVTTLFDHHASFGAIRGSLFAISDALRKLGVRASLCFEISDRAGNEARDAAIAESASWLEACQTRRERDAGFPHRGMVGLHASMTLSDATLRAARALMDAYGVGAHVHVAEGEEDVSVSQRRFQMTPVERLCKHEILREGSIAAHCVYLSSRDLRKLSQSGCSVAHNPLSNLNNAVGIAPILAMRKAGVPIVVGTDGMSAGIATDAKLASVIHRLEAGDVQAGFMETAEALWSTAPKLAQRHFGQRMGVLKQGAVADLLILDAVPPTTVTRDNAASHLLFGVLNASVRTTVIDGIVRMRDFVIEGVDEAELSVLARKQAKALWKRISQSS